MIQTSFCLPTKCIYFGGAYVTRHHDGTLRLLQPPFGAPVFYGRQKAKTYENTSNTFHRKYLSSLLAKKIKV